MDASRDVACAASGKASGKEAQGYPKDPSASKAWAATPRHGCRLAPGCASADAEFDATRIDEAADEIVEFHFVLGPLRGGRHEATELEFDDLLAIDPCCARVREIFQELFPRFSQGDKAGSVPVARSLPPLGGVARKRFETGGFRRGLEKAGVPPRIPIHENDGILTPRIRKRTVVGDQRPAGGKARLRSLAADSRLVG